MPEASHVLRRLHARYSELRRSRRESRFRPRLQRGEGAPLLLSPHLDDAVRGCWSERTGLASPRVIDVFAGAPPAATDPPLWDRITGASDCAARVRERLAEDAQALALAGSEAIHLPLLDVQYRRPGNPLHAEDLDRELASRLTGASSRVLAPAGIGGHP